MCGEPIANLNFYIMKLYKVFLTALSLVVLFSFIACEGDQGPIGLTGSEGGIGPAGPAGENGAQSCLDCHGSNQLITAKMFQWENSIHATGGHYERNQTSCAICHTSQGFLEVVGTGATATAEDISDPLPQNCYTCHQIHQTYTQDDWALTSTEPVTFWVGGETVDIGKANLCINCHQPRLRTPGVPEVGVAGTEMVTSGFWGPHHGAQGGIFAGVGAYEVVGSLPYENSLHTSLTPDACITCHMAPVTGGRAAGGHTFRIETEDGDLNFNGCIACHDDTDALEMLVMNTQTEVDALLLELGTKLNELGLLNDALERIVPGEFTNVQLGVAWNYLYVKEDKSFGVHNAKYTRALLTNSIEAL